MKLKRVLMILAEGFEEIEAISILDILRRAELDVVTAALHSQIVKGAHGLLIQADALLESITADDFGMIVLPGGQPGATHLGNSAQVLNMLQDFARTGRYVAAICAAPMVLAKAGLLDGVEAVCYPGCEVGMGQAIIVDRLVCQSGKLITSKGPATAMLFALKLVELLLGDKISTQIGRDLLLHGR